MPAPAANGRRHAALWWWLLASLPLSYVLGLVLVVLDPYWLDNESLTYIPWSQRWSWAMLSAMTLELFIAPAVLAGYGLWRLAQRAGTPTGPGKTDKPPEVD